MVVVDGEERDGRPSAKRLPPALLLERAAGLWVVNDCPLPLISSQL